MIITLIKPIKAHGEEVTELTLKDPTYAQIEKNGMPFFGTDEGDVKVDMKSALRYLPEMAGVPPSSIEQMSPPDLVKAAYGVVSFFTPNAG